MTIEGMAARHTPARGGREDIDVIRHLVRVNVVSVV